MGFPREVPMPAPVVVAAVAVEATKYAVEATKDIVKGLAGDVSSAASSVVAFVPGTVSPAYSNALVDRVRLKRVQLVEAVTGDLYAKECFEKWYVPCGPVDPNSRGGRTAKLLDTLAGELQVPGSQRANLRARVYQRFHNGPREASERNEALRLELAELKSGGGSDGGEGFGLTVPVVLGAAIGAALGAAVAGKVGAGAGAVAGAIVQGWRFTRGA